MSLLSRKSSLLPWLLGISGLAILAYLWWELGNKGLKADATGTSGSTTPLEMLLMVVGFGLVVASVAIALLRLKRKKSV